MLRLTTCCGCSLRKGSIIIGFLSTACALGLLVWWEAWAGAWGGASSWAEGQRWAAVAAEHSLPLAFVQEVQRLSYSSLSFLTTDVRILFHLLGVTEALFFHFSLILLHGIWKDRALQLKIWIKCTAVTTVLRVVLLLPITVKMIAADFFASGTAAFVLVVITTVFSIYFIIVVNNYRTHMLTEHILTSISMDWPDMK